MATFNHACLMVPGFVFVVNSMSPLTGFDSNLTKGNGLGWA